MSLSTSRSDYKFILYSYFRSSCSWRVRIVLALKRITYEYRAVNLLREEQTETSYVFLNPGAVVPTLLVSSRDDHPTNSSLPATFHTLTQSISIMEFLDEFTANDSSVPSLIPKNIWRRSQMRTIVQLICSDIQPVQNLRVLQAIGKLVETNVVNESLDQKKQKGDEAKTLWAKKWISTGLRAVETVLQTTAGIYCVGDELTLADACLVPQVYNAQRYHVDMSPYPLISRVERALSMLPAFQLAHMKNQPDCPQELRSAL